MTTHWSDALRALNACEEAVTFARQFDTAQAAWDACKRPDWLLWWIGRAGLAGAPGSAERRTLVKVACACACARLALPYVKTGEERPRVAIETAERWADGDPAVTLKDVRVYAADAAYYAAAAVYTDTPAAAADAAAAAAYYAADAAYYAADAAARATVRAQCVAIIRAAYPHPPVKDEVPA